MSGRAAELTPEAPDLAAMVARLRRIPRQDDDYSVSTEGAAARFELDAATLALARSAGLPHGGDADAPLHAPYDLHYLGLRLGLAQAYVWGIGLWRQSLERFDTRPETHVEIVCLPQLPDEQSDVPGRVELAEGETRDVLLRHNHAAGKIVATLTSDWPDLPGDVAGALGEVAALEFCLLPRRLSGDTDLVRQTGLADCLTAALLAVESCRAVGREARAAHGLMVSLPFSVAHSWAEVSIAGRWVPVDPIIIGLMHRYGGLPARAWPVHRSLGPLLHRIGAATSAIHPVTRAGAPVPTTFRTRVLSP